MPRAIWTGSITLRASQRAREALLGRLEASRSASASCASPTARGSATGGSPRPTARRSPTRRSSRATRSRPTSTSCITRDELEELDPKKTKRDRDRGLRRPRPDRPDLLRPPLLPRARHPAPRRPTRCWSRRCASRARSRSPASCSATRRTSRRSAPMDGVLTMATMRFADEVVPPSADRGDARGVAGQAARKQELEMARALIDSLAAEFDPAATADEYREELLALIERKAEGRGGRSRRAPRRRRRPRRPT